MQGVHEVQAEGSALPNARGSSLVARLERLRAVARVRRAARWPLLLAVPLGVLVTDALRRGDRIAGFEGDYRLTYVGALLESVVVWGLLLYAASRRRSALAWLSAFLFVFFVTFTIGGQAYFYDQYHAYLNIDVSLFAANFADSVVNQLFADIGNYAAAKLPPLLVALGLVFVARRWLRPRRATARHAVWLAPLALIAAFFIPTQHRHVQAATPDMLYLHAVGGLVRTQLGLTDQSNQLRPRARQSLPVPPLQRAAVPPRNVLFVILESVRAKAACIEHDPACDRTEATNLLFPERHAFNQMRSMDSCTAVSLAVLWSGVYPTESREVLHTWPLIFDYARATGYDTAFWTSQNMMFGNARLWVKNLGVSQFVSATDLDSTSDLDMGAPENLLADHVIDSIGQLKEPFLGVIQLSNVHYPYYVDPAGPQPFQPATTSKAEDENTAFLNYYQNSVYQQDQHVARILEHVKKSPLGERTVIVYTSDHGEAFREHGQMGHTFSVFDEEIHVPAWIAAPPGTLTDEERANLERKKNAFLFHVDLAPTVLDLIGVGDAPQIAEYKSKMHGHSLLRPELSEQPVPLTNCAGVWSCAFENWGYMQKNMKLEARSWDVGWKCYDLAKDPLELENLGVERCGDLAQRAMQT
ncbi:MAG TPA: sulfatase-like hydrolase/transferase, partial [Polyangiaceae bacterium]|nr:sulfatase-like hydrolase/transferase [Polyangiaceae bacterium]